MLKVPMANYFVPSDGRWFIVKREESRRYRSELTRETFGVARFLFPYLSGAEGNRMTH